MAKKRFEEQLSVLAVRVQPASKVWVDKEAKEMGVSRTVLLRAMFSVARSHMGEVRKAVALRMEAEA